MAPVPEARETLVGQGLGANLQGKGYRGLWPWGPTVGGERGQPLLDPTSEARPYTAGSLSAQLRAAGCLWAPGTPTIFPNYRASLLASGKLPPAKGPQTNYSKNRLGVSKELLGWTCGVDGEPTMGGSPSHTLPFPRLRLRPH